MVKNLPANAGRTRDMGLIPGLGRSHRVGSFRGFPGSAGDMGLIPGLGRSPGGEHGNLLQYSCLENPYGQRSLAGYSPCG